MVRVIQEVEPICFEQAVGNSKWDNAMDEEMAALDANATWELVALPEDKKAIGCKWVYKVKHNADGFVSRYKARLVAKGYAQTYGIDYEETYSLVAKMTTVRAIIAMATAKGWSLHQMDVKNVFLHGDLQEEVYMEQPPGYVDQTHPNLVCRLKKALYGLKQAPRAWSKKIGEYLVTSGFQTSDADFSLYVKKTNHGIVVIVIRIVENLIYMTITRPNLSYAVGVVTRFMQTPRKPHLDVVRHILRYIKHTLQCGIFYEAKNQLQVHGYTDANWVDNVSNRRSTSGFMFSFGNGAVSWSSKKQPTVALSSTEAEYKGAIIAACEIVWLQKLLSNLGQSVDALVVIYCDNISSILFANNPIYHARTKHIEVHYHFIREKVLAKEIDFIHVSTEDQVADIFTKALGIDKLRKFRKMFNVLEMDLNLRGSVENSSSTS